mmetsp:Transcript_84251/g.255693  ORF Transcript_84251/g.255693 Transcript_84251/m.255693 type:complete len:80 (+) Transcript_84251:130-369(+)
MAPEGNEVTVRAQRQLSIWSIGAGFEGTASDWTEYVVCLVGFIALVWFLWSRNVSAMPDADLTEFPDETSASVDESKQD